MTFLTIAIPTYNRSNYLKLNLHSLLAEINSLPASLRSSIQIIISDNCSTDSTREVCSEYESSFDHFKYICNPTNLGWAKNFIQCALINESPFLLLMGDDDLFTQGTLLRVLQLLEEFQPGVLVLRPFGYDNDSILECPAYNRDRLRYTINLKFWFSNKSLFHSPPLVLNTSLLDKSCFDSIFILIYLLFIYF